MLTTLDSIAPATWTAREAEFAASDTTPASSVYCWPHPPYAAYPASAPQTEPIECQSETCTPLDVPDALKQADIPACCAENGECGLDSSRLSDYGLSFNEVCQPKHQPGEANADCPDSAPLMLPGTTVTLGALKGCCRTETSSCGYLLVIGGLIDTELGCVDSAPFLEGGAPPSCDP